MKQFFKAFLLTGIALFSVILAMTAYNSVKPNKEKPLEGLEWYSKSPKDGLYEAMEYYGILHSDVVYAQAVLESGNFKSELAVKHNNLFGLYNSSKKEYYKFNHWSESVKAYRDLVQYKFIKKQKQYEQEMYYKFLVNMKYAEDPEYILRLRRIVEKF